MHHESVDPQHFITNELFNPLPNGQLLWRLRFGGSVLDARLASVGKWGVAYRLYLNGRFTFSERFDSEEDARTAAEQLLARRIGDGWLQERVFVRTA